MLSYVFVEFTGWSLDRTTHSEYSGKVETRAHDNSINNEEGDYLISIIRSKRMIRSHVIRGRE